MDIKNPEEPERFPGLDRTLVDILVRWAYAEGDLTEKQQFFWGLKNGYVPADGEEEIANLNYARPIPLERAVEIISESYSRVTIESVASVLELAEAKIQKFVWDAVNDALWEAFDKDHQNRDS